MVFQVDFEVNFSIELHPSVNVTSGDATFSLDVEAGGYGAVMMTSSAVDQDFQVHISPLTVTLFTVTTRLQ